MLRGARGGLMWGFLLSVFARLPGQNGRRHLLESLGGARSNRVVPRMKKCQKRQ